MGGVAPEAGSGGEVVVGPACGDGTVDAGEDCDDGNTVDLDGCSSLCTDACEACEIWHAENGGPDHPCIGLREYCSQPYGATEEEQALDVALEGGAATVARNLLCLDVIACVRETNCVEGASPTLSNCYCGYDPENPTCASPSGACKDEIEYAAESDDVGTVGARFAEHPYAIARASFLIDYCDIPYCHDQCFAGAPWTPP
jgi:cysteine-rich repeat protein